MLEGDQPQHLTFLSHSFIFSGRQIFRSQYTYSWKITKQGVCIEHFSGVFSENARVRNLGNLIKMCIPTRCPRPIESDPLGMRKREEGLLYFLTSVPVNSDIL